MGDCVNRSRSESVPAIELTRMGIAAGDYPVERTVLIRVGGAAG